MAGPNPFPIHTPELLEMILAHLPQRNLLLAQSVCKNWHYLISTSPTLQTLLYFRPSSASLTTTRSHDFLNPLIASEFPALLSVEGFKYSELDVSLNHPHTDRDIITATETRLERFFGSFNRRPEAFRRREASWRRMQIASPPVTTVVFRWHVSGMMGVSAEECVVRFGKGDGSNSNVTKDEGGDARRIEKPGITLVTRATGSEDADVKEEVDLCKEGGLTMGLLYDYLFGEISSGGIPTEYNADYECGEYPAPDEVAAYAVENEDISLGALIRSDGKPKRELTMMVELRWAYTCIVEEEESLPELRSEAHRDVEVRPMVNVKSKMWD